MYYFKASWYWIFSSLVDEYMYVDYKVVQSYRWCDFKMQTLDSGLQIRCQVVDLIDFPD